eukprot:410151_1
MASFIVLSIVFSHLIINTESVITDECPAGGPTAVNKICLYALEINGGCGTCAQNQQDCNDTGVTNWATCCQTGQWICSGANDEAAVCHYDANGPRIVPCIYSRR